VDAEAYLAERGRLVDVSLARALAPSDAIPEVLLAAMRHLVLPGGKRLRPALAFAAAEAVGAAPERALAMATAVELVHCYSLIHDDLPCMDDDDERRGRPTVHVAYGEATAVLAGDALLALAFEVLAAEAQEPARSLCALRLLAEAAGPRQLVGGQIDDLRSDAVRAAPETVLGVHRRKTAALIGAALVGGACLAGADAAALERLSRFGAHIGVAFQIADDLLDRARDGGCSLVPLVGADAARARAASLLHEALELLEPFGGSADPLRELARFAVGRAR
jgi:geranylgeranyl pyrophosphate synthase